MMDDDEESYSINSDIEIDNDDSGDYCDDEGVDGIGGGDATDRKVMEKGSTPYKCLSTANLTAAMNATIKETNNLLQLPESTVRLLLAHFKWDKDRLLEKYFEDPCKTFADAHVPDPRINSQKSVAGGSQSQAAGNKKRPKAGTRSLFCTICFCDGDEKDTSALSCAHRFCNDCWTSYIKNRLSEANDVINCPEPKCSLLADDNFVRDRLHNDAAAIERFEYLISQSFVSNNHLMKWCASPQCDRAFQMSSRDWVALHCDRCNAEWCSLCVHSWHYPVTCQYFKKWLKKNADDSETAHWINANTKDCPKCHAPIEKNGGCNHMTCRSKSCKNEFCWVCMGDWSKHGGQAYNCNRFEEGEAGSGGNAKEHARVSLERYLFFYTRYANHEKSRELEKKLQISIDAKIQELQVVYHMARPEAIFLQQAFDTLARCRRTLMYTYAFAYFLRKNWASEIFADNQSNLEQKTESLSEYLEKEFEDVPDVNKMKQDVQDKTRYCEQRRQRLIEHVQEGYNNRTWDMTD